MDFDKVENRLKKELEGSGHSAVGTNKSEESLKGKPPVFGRELCAIYKWLNANTGYVWTSYAEIDGNGGVLGLRAVKGDEVKTIEIPFNGGHSGDPRKQAIFLWDNLLKGVVADVYASINEGRN